MRNLVAMVVIGVVGFQWALLAAWAVDRDLGVYRAGWAEAPVDAPAAPLAEAWSPGTTLASAGITP